MPTPYSMIQICVLPWNKVIITLLLKLTTSNRYPSSSHGASKNQWIEQRAGFALKPFWSSKRQKADIKEEMEGSPSMKLQAIESVQIMTKHREIIILELQYGNQPLEVKKAVLFRWTLAEWMAWRDVNKWDTYPLRRTLISQHVSRRVQLKRVGRLKMTLLWKTIMG